MAALISLVRIEMGQIQSLFERKTPNVNSAGASNTPPGVPNGQKYLNRLRENSAATASAAAAPPAAAPPAPVTQGGRRRNKKSRKAKKTRKIKRSGKSRKNRK